MKNIVEGLADTRKAAHKEYLEMDELVTQFIEAGDVWTPEIQRQALVTMRDMATQIKLLAGKLQYYFEQHPELV